MKNNLTIIAALMLFLCMAAPYAEAQQPTFQDDNLYPEAFAAILKDEWTYLRDAVEQMNKETEKRGEFETTPEFQERVARRRQIFLDKLNTHIKEFKLDRRVFGIWFKAVLDSYDADAGIYSVRSFTVLEAPYDLPTVNCFVPPNSYVELADSILGGYRTSNIRLKFDPDFKWTVGRNDAMTAKGYEANVYFKVHFAVDISQENITTQATLKIVPKDILLMNMENKYVYWKDEMK